MNGTLDWGEVERIVFSAHPMKEGLHGIEHVRKAAENARILAGAECPDFYDDAVLGAYLHDIGRTEDGAGNLHAISGAKIAEKMLKKHWSHLDCERIVYAIRYHADGLVSDDPLVGAIWDADRLELGRVGIPMSAVKFSTKTAKEMAGIR